MLEVLRSGRLSLGPEAERVRATRSPSWLGSDDAVAVSSGTAGAPPRRPGAGLGRGRRGPDHARSASSPPPTACSTRARAGLLRHRPGHAQHRSRPRPRPPSASGTAGILPVHIFGYPADLLGAGEHRRRPRDPDPRGRLPGARRRRRRGPRVGTARQPRHLRLLRQQADDHGGGRDARPAPARRWPSELRSERNQGRAADMSRGRPRPASASTTG